MVAPVTSYAVSGLLAQSARLEAVANNLANVSSTGPVPAAAGAGFASNQQKPYTPVSVETIDGPGGVRTIVRPLEPASTRVFDPKSPYADGNGMIAAPNIDPIAQFRTLLESQSSFALNAAVIKTSDAMVQSLYQAWND